MTRLTIHMHKGDPHVLDFPDGAAASAALEEVQQALSVIGRGMARPVTIAGRLVIRPAEVRSAELGDPPSIG